METPLPTRFFKIIFESILQAKKLRMPEKFAMKYGGELSDIACIYDPDGIAWEMRLTKSSNQIWFDGGWQEFVENYSIRSGHLLVFRYEGSSTFRVRIFDMTSCEIDYPSFDGGNEHQIDDDDDDDSVEVIGSITYPNASPGKSKKSQISSEKKLHGSLASQGTQESKRSTIPAARMLKSAHPYITITMKSYYINNGYLHLSRPFAAAHLLPSKSVKLQAGDGREWSVRAVMGEKRMTLTTGWKDFVRENKLEVGDVCVFEVISRTSTPVLKVSISSST
ncbi:hypothetical protein Tsubulata_023089 [Turnera subulata]|uniref:TF-B3 domain-containing protein n=1 Tax=Turnera subulata TaxID=218843 RepID=A0A9Q0FTR2_9ROSI|nr:hypothetical protein Tsubulata_023089 [Turnera subulata]